MPATDNVGVVVIGRNEGERLKRCLLSLTTVPHRVYVDSASIDDSCELARSLGFDVVELTSPPGFSAARARNAGIDRLCELAPHIQFVQVVDGDCVVDAKWLSHAVSQLNAMPEVAILFGRRRELRPDANLYHRACDHEWAVPAGSASSCGGDALIRLSAILGVAKYNAGLIAGEEPDLCLRLRQKGWMIWSNTREMTLHDVDIVRFSQWWRRARRAGFAIAKLVDMYGKEAEPSWRRYLWSAAFWLSLMAALPLSFILALLIPSTMTAAISMGAASLLAVQMFRLVKKADAARHHMGQALADAALTLVTKIPTAHGILEFHIKEILKRDTKIIEYKKNYAPKLEENIKN